MTKMTDDEREALIQRVFDAHGFVPGKTTHPTVIREIGANLRAEFDRAGARWDEIGQFAARFIHDWRRHPNLTSDQCLRTCQAFCDGYGLDVDVTQLL